jgi:hypothetical protein
MEASCETPRVSGLGVGQGIVAAVLCGHVRERRAKSPGFDSEGNRGRFKTSPPVPTLGAPTLGKALPKLDPSAIGGVMSYLVHLSSVNVDPMIYAGANQRGLSATATQT